MAVRGGARIRTRFLLVVALALAATLVARGAWAGQGGAPDAIRAAAERDGATAGDFLPVAGMRSFARAAGVHEWRFEAVRGPSRFDRIGLERVAHGKTPLSDPPAVVLYLPGTFMNGAVAIDDPRYSMPLFMAEHGVDFWSFDYRTHFVPPATPPDNLGVMADWSDDVFLGDIDAAARFVGAATGHRRIFLAGFSRGAEFAYLFAARYPERVAGLIILDGLMPASDLPGAPAPGHYADDVSGTHLTWERRAALMRAVIEHPDGPAPIPKFATARENLEQVVDTADGFFGGHGGLANPLGGFSDATTLARTLARYDRYWPAIQDHEQPFAPDVRAALARSAVPVIAFASTNIGPHWSQGVAASARAAGGSGATVTTLAGWGHLDVICGTLAATQVFAPTLEWLRRRPTR